MSALWITLGLAFAVFVYYGYEHHWLGLGDSIDAVDNTINNGQAAHDIIKFAKDNTSDLIVIATHGITGFEHFLLGSVTEKVVRMSPCPVFTVKSFGKSLI